MTFHPKPDFPPMAPCPPDILARLTANHAPRGVQITGVDHSIQIDIARATTAVQIVLKNGITIEVASGSEAIIKNSDGEVIARTPKPYQGRDCV